MWVIGEPDTALDLGKQVPEDVTLRAHEGGWAKEEAVAFFPPPLLGCRIGKPLRRGQARSPGGGPKALVRAVGRLDGAMRRPRLASLEGRRFPWSAGLCGCRDSQKHPQKGEENRNWQPRTMPGRGQCRRARP